MDIKIKGQYGLLQGEIRMNITTSIILTLLIYLPFHLFEEAIGDFPKWMYEHKWLPHHMSHGHWMANNIFIYYPFLLIAVSLYLFENKTFLCCGIGVLIWGVINFCDHVFYTIKDRRISPGIITGTLFMINSIVGIKYALTFNPSMVIILISIIIGGILFGVPIGLCMLFHNTIEKFIK